MPLFFESKAICSFAYGFFFYTLFSVRGCIFMEQTLMDKLTILADSAKYDVACTSSGASRTARAGTVGSCYAPGCCHAFTADGRCMSLLKVLMTNCCSFDCGYCVNRKSNDIPRATFAPRELAELTMEFYRRNYIEGLFLSSAVLGSPDYTTVRGCIFMEQTLMDKLTILADSAKYDVACTSSGASRTARAGTVGSCYAPGCCHAFTADGRCMSLLKVLMTNCCSFDCGYCVNRKSNDIPRATFAPRELAELTMEFYRRNYIEGLFLSSAVLGSPDYTTERMLTVLRLLRGEYRFGGYIHAKAIPGTSPELVQQLGYLADRLSVNVELPSERSLNLLAPDKGRHSIFRPMKQIAVSGAASREELTLYRHAPKFAPAGQSTQMIVGASPETDYHILKLTEGMYQKYSLKRVFYSAYIPVAEDTRLPALDTKPPLLREHRLYQADWLLRFYQFEADEILDQDNPNFNPYLDPKCNWAVQHYGLFPVDVNRAPFEMLLRVPGIGPKSARRIWRARKQAALGLDELKRMGVVLKRAQYFIICRGFAGAHPGRGSAGRECITRALIDPNVFSGSCEQLSLFSPPAVDNLIEQGVPPRAAVRMVREEAVQCLAKAL